MERAKVILQRIGVVLACVAVLSYTVFHIVSLFESEISTIVVGETTQETRLGFDGYIFRDEALVSSSYTGAVDYVAHDGLKVSASETLAYVYERGNDESVSERIKIIDRDIAVINSALSGKLSLDDLPALNGSAGNMHTDIQKRLANGELRGLREDIDALTSELDRITHIIGNKDMLRSTLDSLVAERAALIAASGNKEEIKSQQSGYFYSGVDGYESIFTVSAAEEMTLEDFEGLISTSPLQSSAVGKMAYDAEWRFAVILDSDDASYFEEGGRYEFIFTGNGDIKFPMTLTRRDADDESDNELLVFFCDRAPSSFSFDRYQSVEAVVESASGITVPKSAVHKSGGELYVYILNGSVVLERRIKVVHTGSDFYIAADGAYLDSGDGAPYLKSNDVLIIDGNNLFDGRIIE